MYRVIKIVFMVGFFAGFAASLYYEFHGNDLRALYFLAFSAYCGWIAET